MVAESASLGCTGSKGISHDQHDHVYFSVTRRDYTEYGNVNIIDRNRQQNFPSLSSRTQKGESLGPGLVSVLDSDSKFRDAQESDSVSDSSLRFVQCQYQNGDIKYSFIKGKRENRNRNTEILVLRLVSDSVSDSIFINGPDSDSESVSYLRLKQSQTRNWDSKMGTRETLLQCLLNG